MAKKTTRSKLARNLAIVIGIAAVSFLTVGSVLSGIAATRDAKKAATSVSLLYLNELASRREQIVEANIQEKIKDIDTAVSLMTDDDLANEEALKNYQAKMKKIYSLEKFAFVDEDGRIYTAIPTEDKASDYSFDYRTLSKPDVSIFNINSEEKKVVVAVPLENLSFGGKAFKVCFMESAMSVMIEGLSLDTDASSNTFCNLYTNKGIALTNYVLGRLSSDGNLLTALSTATYEEGYNYQAVLNDFAQGKSGVTAFTYEGVPETLSYVPVDGTDWFLTYLIRDTVISERINESATQIVVRNSIISILTAALLIAAFVFLILQQNHNAKMRLASETLAVENKIKQEELESRLALQEKLLEQEKEKHQQDQLITALSSDYLSVYYIELEKNEGVCYQSRQDSIGLIDVGERFPYLEKFKEYADRFITPAYHDEFLSFIDPNHLREALKSRRVISFRYTIKRGEEEEYEMIRFAGVRHPEDREDGIVHAVGACFTNVDEETRASIAQNNILTAALSSAEQASKAKTVFLSNMSHEIRTPLNAIIGLNSIALSEEDVSPKMRDRLTKIGSSAEHLLRLINDILDMSRIESGKMVLKHEEFSFAELIEQINAMFSVQCHEKGLEYHCSFEGAIDNFYIGDDMKLRQVLINLLGNAVKFTPSGSVNFKVSKVNESGDKTVLRFVVSDTGIGISKEFLPHLFDSFAQENNGASNKYGSSGLGLAITKNVIEMMNGTIEVQSEKGEGSTFTVNVTLDNSASPLLLQGQEDIHPEKMRVLIIDDDSIAREHALAVLEKAKMHCDDASSGEEALGLVKKAHDGQRPYSLILVDWRMPGMDGIETIQKIRELTGLESTIVMVTAFRYEELLDKPVSASIDGFIPKPLFLANVLEEYAKALAHKSTEESKKAPLASLKGKRILHAEDMELNAEIMRAILESEGVEVDIVENGRLCLERFLEKGAGYYDAILMDLRMPEMDGLEATRRIRSSAQEDAKTIPIIALTANAFDEDVQQSLQAGMNAHLSKPIRPEILFETLKSLLS